MTQATERYLDELRSEEAKLPNRTLFGLALAGLRVRLMRSLVTLIAVTLAIAYLTYMGANNATIFRLATAADPKDREEINTRLQGAGINVEVVRQARPDPALPGPVRALMECFGNALDRWLATMALLTCAVGIANAMLMTVTERIREIGTMKCLGAEDFTVIKLFLIESALMGAVGSALGVLLGFIISLVVGLAQYSYFAWSYMPGFSVMLYSVLSFCTGILLCLLAAGYPAYVAARMRPVDALRIEE